MEYLPLGPMQFSKAKGHQETKKRNAATQHIDDEGTVEISFFKDGFLLRESVSWDGETDTTRVVLLPADEKVATGEKKVAPGAKQVEKRTKVIRVETAWRTRRKLRARRMMKLGGKKKKVLKRASVRVSTGEEVSPSRDTNIDSEAVSHAGRSQTT